MVHFDKAMGRSGGTYNAQNAPSDSLAHKFEKRAAAGEWHNFMSSKIADIYKAPKGHKKQPSQDEEDMDVQKLMKDVETFASSYRSWTERKAIQNKNAVALGCKPEKKHRTPLSVAIPAMKNQKKREQKKIEEERILGIFAKTNKNKQVQKCKPEDRALKASEGRFSRGVLNVKHILEPRSSKAIEDGHVPSNKAKKKGKGKGKGKGKNKGKRKGR